VCAYAILDIITKVIVSFMVMSGMTALFAPEFLTPSCYPCSN
jgi:hypothetical protein